MPPPFRKRPRLSHNRGFTILELSIVAAIIAVVAILALTVVRKVAKNARTTRIANDLRIFTASFNAYAQEYGTMPAIALPGQIPTGMGPFLQNSVWTAPTPIGGYFFWVSNITFNGIHYNGVILIFSYNGSNVTTDMEQINDLDRKIDDGNTTTGLFQYISSSYLMYVVDK